MVFCVRILSYWHQVRTILQPSDTSAILHDVSTMADQLSHRTSHTQVVPSVLCSHPWAKHLNPTVYLSRHTGCILPEASLSEAHSFLLKETQKHTEHTSVCSGTELPYSMAGSFFYSFCSHCQRFLSVVLPEFFLLGGRVAVFDFTRLRLALGCFCNPPPSSQPS